MLLNGDEIALDRLRPEGHGAVDPGADGCRASAPEIAPVARRNFDRGADIAGLDTPLHIVFARDRRFLSKVARASQFLEVGAALMAVVAIENRKGEIVDIEGNARSENQHQKGGAQERKAHADRIAQEFEAFLDRAGRQSAQHRCDDARLARALRLGGAHETGDIELLSPVRLFETGDEGLFQIGGALGLDDRLRSSRGQHAACIHQGQPVASRRLVHEMGRDENGDALAARQIEQMFPEFVARDRIDAGGRLVQDQQLWIVDDGDGKRQALTNAERQFAGPLIEMVREPKISHELFDARRRNVRAANETDARGVRDSAGR